MIEVPQQRQTLEPKYSPLQIVDAGSIARNPDPTKRTNEAINLSHFKTIAKDVGFVIAHEAIVLVGPHGYGGNHIHRRKEFQVALNGNPVFIYRDEAGRVIEEEMGRDEEGGLKAFVVPEFLPHAVLNPDDQPAAIFEFYDIAPGGHGFADFRKLTPEENLLPASLGQ